MKHKLKSEDLPEESIREKDRQLVIATLREAVQNGQYQTRVAAAKTLAGIQGFDQAPDRAGEELDKLVDAFKEVAKVLPD